MSKRSVALVLIAAVLIVAGAIALRGQGAGALMHWLAAMHGH